MPQASEGGHASFAPRNPFEIDLLRHLQRTHSHVSFERVLSGPGLAALYAFERSCSQESEPAWLSAEIAAAGDAVAGRHGGRALGEGSRGRAHPRALRLDLRRRGRKPRAQGPRDGRRFRGRRDRSQDPAEAPRRDVFRGLLRQGALRAAPREDSDTRRDERPLRAAWRRARGRGDGLWRKIGTRLHRFLFETERQIPEATGELSALLSQLAFAGKRISRMLSSAGLTETLGASGEVERPGRAAAEAGRDRERGLPRGLRLRTARPDHRHRGDGASRRTSPRTSRRASTSSFSTRWTARPTWT